MTSAAAPAAADASSAALPAPRKLRLKARAERMEETRERIARAAYELHASIGPARTTISAIAERAGVQRLTVYKHFPTDSDIAQACSSHFWAIDPPPDPDDWSGITAPEQRLRQALGELYPYYRRNELLFMNLERDMPLFMEQLPGEPPPTIAAFNALPARWQAALSAGWPDDARAVVRGAAIGVALAFTTWHTLARGQGLDDGQAVELMVALVRCAASEAALG